MKQLKIRNWDKWQTYRSDRSQPPWIKVHRCVMRDPQWVSLTDAQRGQLLQIWLLAADRQGKIPANPEIVRKLCFMEQDPDFALFASLGFIEQNQQESPHDANMAPTRRQPDDNPQPTCGEPAPTGSHGGDGVTLQPDSAHEKNSNENNTNHQVTPTRRQDDANVTCQSRLDKTRLEKDIRGKKQKNCPYQKIVDLYHEILPQLPKVHALSSTRRSNIRQRHTQDMEKDLENWASYFRLVSRSSFLMGLAQPIGERKVFRADLDWITKQSNFLKIVEGKYHG